MEKIPVLFCTDGIHPHQVGGMQRHSRLLIEELVAQGEVELTVVHPHSEQVFPGEMGVKEIQLQGIDQGKNYLRECHSYSRRVLEVAKAHPDHVIYSQGLCIWQGIDEIADRVIVNPHGLEPYQVLTAKEKLVAIPFKKIFDRIFNKAGHVISLGGGLTTILESRIRKQDKIVVLPNATVLPELPVHRVWPEAGDPIRLLFVSRFAANKGIHVLMDAIQQLNKEGLKDKLTFELAGKGPLFEHYSGKFPLPNVNYHGFVSDEQLAQLYHDCHVFVLPTLFEGMPTVVLEAMARSLPIIVSDVGATAEQVDETNGWLIQKNSVDALVHAIRAYLHSNSTRKAMLADASHQRLSERFTWPIVATAHTRLFRGVYESNHPNATPAL